MGFTYDLIYGRDRPVDLFLRISQTERETDGAMGLFIRQSHGRQGQ